MEEYYSDLIGICSSLSEEDDLLLEADMYHAEKNESNDINCPSIKKEKISETDDLLSWMNSIKIDNKRNLNLLDSPNDERKHSKKADYKEALDFALSTKSPNKFASPLKNRSAKKSSPPLSLTKILRSSNLTPQKAKLSGTKIREKIRSFNFFNEVSVVVKINQSAVEEDLGEGENIDRRMKESMQHCLFPIVNDSMVEKSLRKRLNQISGLVLVNPVVFGSKASEKTSESTPRKEMTCCYQFDDVIWPSQNHDVNPRQEKMDSKSASNFVYVQDPKIMGIVDNIIENAIVGKTNSVLFALGGAETKRTNTLLGHSNWIVDDDKICHNNIGLLGMVVHTLFSRINGYNPYTKCEDHSSTMDDFYWQSFSSCHTITLSMFGISDEDDTRDILQMNQEKKANGPYFLDHSNPNGSFMKNFMEIKLDSFATFQESIRMASETILSSSECTYRCLVTNVKISLLNDDLKENVINKEDSVTIQCIDLNFNNNCENSKIDRENLLAMLSNNERKHKLQNETALFSILKDTLPQSNCKATIIATVCPARKSFSTTSDTLSYVHKIMNNENKEENDNCNLSSKDLFLVDSPNMNSKSMKTCEPRFFLSPSKRNIGRKRKSCHDMIQLLTGIETKSSDSLEEQEIHKDEELRSLHYKETTSIKIHELEESVRKLEDKLKESEKERSDDIKELENENKKLRLTMSDLGREIAAIEKKREDEKKMYEISYKELQNKVKGESIVNDTLNDLQEQLQKAEKHKKDAIRECEGLEKGMDLLGEEIGEISVQLEETEQEKEELITEVNDLRLRNLSYLKGKDALENDLEKTKRQMQAMSLFFNTEFDKLSSSLGNSKEEIQTKLIIYESEIEKLRDSLNKSEIGTKDAILEKEAIQDELDRLKSVQYVDDAIAPELSKKSPTKNKMTVGDDAQKIQEYDDSYNRCKETCEDIISENIKEKREGIKDTINMLKKRLKKNERKEYSETKKNTRNKWNLRSKKNKTYITLASPKKNTKGS